MTAKLNYDFNYPFVSSDLFAMTEYVSRVDDLIKSVAKNYELQIESENQDNYYWEYSHLYSISEEYFPSIIRNSVIVAIYAMFESSVYQLLGYAKNKENVKLSAKFLKPNKPNDGLCGIVNFYMSEVLNLEFEFDKDDIQKISNLYLVRNIMAHENGYIGGDNLKKSKIENLKKQYESFGLSVVGQQVKLDQIFLEFYLNQIKKTLSKLMCFLEEKYDPFDREVAKELRENVESIVSQVKKQNGKV